MNQIAIIVGSTRPGRNGDTIARWVYENASRRHDARFKLVDIADYDLPLLDEPSPPIFGRYTKPHTRAWSKTIAAFDGYVFVTPEYNRAIPASLKNAIDFLYGEWNNKAAGIVSYGGSGGMKAAENLRLILGELMIADVRAEVNLSLHTDFENFSAFKPAGHQEERVHVMLDQVIAWSGALKPLREKANSGEVD